MKPEKCEHPKKASSTKKIVKAFGIGTLLGMVAGAIIGVFNAPKKGEEFKDEVKEKAEILQKSLKETTEEIRARVDRIFGKITAESLALYADTRKEILSEVTALKGDIKRSEYEAIVDRIIEKYKGRKKVFSKKLDVLGREFKKEWVSLKNNLSK